MRIAVWHNLPYGGAWRALYEHLEALHEAGHYIEIWTTDLHYEDRLTFKKFGKTNIVPLKNLMAGLHGHYRSPKRINITKRVISILQKVQKVCAQEINAGGFDKAFVNSCAVSYMPFISNFLTIPCLIYLGEPYRWLYEASPENVWQAPKLKWYEVKKRIQDFLTVYARRMQVREEIGSAKKYNKILVNSYYSKESVIKAYGLEPEVCRLGVDTAFFAAPENTVKGDYVVSIGFLYPPKGVDRAILLLSKLHASIRPKLYWISNAAVDHYLEEMKAYAKLLEVDFIPLINVTDEELIRYVSGARFMIYTPRLEPLGLSPLEANACGTFVIGIAEAGVRETVTHGQNGYLIENVYDPAFQRYAQKLLTDKMLANELGKKAALFVTENWSFFQLKENFLRAVTDN